MKVTQDKFCDPEARYAAEFELRNFEVTDRAVVSIGVSCFAATRSGAIRDLKTTLKAVIEQIEKELK